MKSTKTAASKIIIRFNAMLRELFPNNHAEAKAGILDGHGAASTLGLTEAQLLEIVEWLETERAKRKAEPSRAVRQARSKCLGLLTDIGVNTSDWAKVNKYLEQPRICNGRRLYDLDEAELEALRKKLFAIKSEYSRRAQDEKHWANNN